MRIWKKEIGINKRQNMSVIQILITIISFLSGFIIGLLIKRTVIEINAHRIQCKHYENLVKPNKRTIVIINGKTI